jgi:hypothetical protein
MTPFNSTKSYIKPIAIIINYTLFIKGMKMNAKHMWCLLDSDTKKRIGYITNISCQILTERGFDRNLHFDIVFIDVM